MSAERKRGAPKGNQNARKHGFYSKVLDEAEQLDFELAAGVEGIDDEVTLLRVKIKSLARLIKTRYNITKTQKKGLKEAIGNVLKEVALPLGIAIGGATIKK